VKSAGIFRLSPGGRIVLAQRCCAGDPVAPTVLARRALFFTLLLFSTVLFASEKHPATGLLISIDRAHHQLVLSIREIPGYMEAMEMPFFVRNSKTLDAFEPGTTLDFDILDENGKPYAENLRIHEFQSMELDPTAARRLHGVEQAMDPNRPKPVAVGQLVPDFQLTDEQNQPVRLSQFDGKVVAVTFMYTRCPFPQYCVRLSNNFARVQKRFHQQMGSDLVLLNIVIDTGHDQPETLATYAKQYKADPQGWHFLSGSLGDVQKVARYFDMNYYPDEGLYIHSFHTAVLDRNHKLVANLEGNDFTAKQLGDLVENVLHRPNPN
jgi:protein SCO1